MFEETPLHILQATTKALKFKMRPLNYLKKKATKIGIKTATTRRKKKSKVQCNSNAVRYTR